MAMSSPRLGLFLGAGFSYEAGMPLVWGLTAEIKKWLTPEKFRELNEAWAQQGGRYSDDVVEDFVSILKLNSIHYESILGHVEVQMQRHGPDQQAYHRLYSWLVELVYRLLYYRQVNNDQLFAWQLEFYSGIKALASGDTPLWVFSLNHDLMVEAIAQKHSIPLHTGFSRRLVTLPRRNAKGEKIGELRAETLTKQELEEQAMHFPNPPLPGICLLKIHGALDVFTFNEGEDLLKLVPDGDGMGSVFSALRAANEDLLYPVPDQPPRDRVHALNEIAYADENGVMQFLRRSLLAGAYKFDPHKHQVMPKSMLRHFRSHLNYVTKLTCIGYGFGDIHINQILKEWLSSTRGRHLEIVDPSIHGVPSFLLHLSPQITLVKSGTTAYLDSVAGIERSYKEQLLKKISEKARQIGPKARELMARFATSDLERTRAALQDKLKELPTKNGTPDPEAIADPQALAASWAKEIYGSEEQRLEGMLRALEEPEKL